MLFFVHQTIYLLACTCIRLFICGLLLVSDYYLLASTLLFICYFLLAVIYLISHSLRVRGCARGHADIRGQRVRVLFYARSGLRARVRARVLACGCGFIKPISARILPVDILMRRCRTPPCRALLLACCAAAARCPAPAPEKKAPKSSEKRRLFNFQF